MAVPRPNASVNTDAGSGTGGVPLTVTSPAKNAVSIV
jgi:hypothetical protein